jgi:hypothetical protein
MGKKVNIESGGEAGNQCRWSCLYCGTMGPWTSQTIAVSTGEAHGEISAVTRCTKKLSTVTRI